MKNEIHINTERGFALVVVLLILLLVTALAAELIFTVRTGIQEGRQSKQHAISRGLAKAGISLALFHLIDRPVELTEEGAYIPGTKATVYLTTGKVNFQIISESGKIDLNNMNYLLLRQFLEQQGYEPDEQEILIDSIQDWRDNDEFHRLNGAESDYYETLTVPYKPRNGPFTDVSEILLVRGAEKLSGKINPADFFTIQNPTGRINFNMLNTGMLQIITGDDEKRIQQYHELKEEGLPLGEIEAQLILDENYAMWQPYLVYSKGNNQYYTAIATGFAGMKSLDANPDNVAKTRKYSGCRIQLLLRLTGNNFRYERWSEENIIE